MTCREFCKRDFLPSSSSHILLVNIWNFLSTLELSLPFVFHSSNCPLFPSLLASLSCPLISSARYFEVISSSRKNSVFLRAKDPAMAQSWYNAIQAGAANLLPRVKEEMKSMQLGMEVKHLGWITEQVCKNTVVYRQYYKTCSVCHRDLFFFSICYMFLCLFHIVFHVLIR